MPQPFYNSIIVDFVEDYLYPDTDFLFQAALISRQSIGFSSRRLLFLQIMKEVNILNRPNGIHHFH